MKAIDEDGHQLDLARLTDQRDAMYSMNTHFQQCLEHCQNLERLLRDLRTEGECFPIIVGRRPAIASVQGSSTNMMTPRLQNVNFFSSCQIPDVSYSPNFHFLLDVIVCHVREQCFIVATAIGAIEGLTNIPYTGREGENTGNRNCFTGNCWFRIMKMALITWNLTFCFLRSCRTVLSKSSILTAVDCRSFSRIKAAESHTPTQMAANRTTQQPIHCPKRYAFVSRKSQSSLSIWWRTTQIHIRTPRFCHHRVATHALPSIENVRNRQRPPHRTWDTSDDGPLQRYYKFVIWYKIHPRLPNKCTHQVIWL